MHHYLIGMCVVYCRGIWRLHIYVG